MFLVTKSKLEFTYVGLSRGPTGYENGELDIVSKVTSELAFDDVADPEHVSNNNDSLDVVLLPVTANIAANATKGWIVSTDVDMYAVDPSLTSEGSCLGRDLVTNVKSTVEIPTNGDDTRYKLACVDCSLSPWGTPPREIMRSEEDTPEEQSDRPASVNQTVTWTDPDNDGAELMVKPAYNWLNIEADADLAVAHGKDSLDGEVLGGHFIHQNEADTIPGAAWNDPDNNVKGSKDYP